VFRRLEGVKSVLPGYTGGRVDNPSYDDVCTGRTGHAEAAQIEFDPDVISFEKLLDVFWHTHDPTTLNRQGNDVGTQYRSAIFYHNEKQKEIAEKSKKEIGSSGVYRDPIVTEITPFKRFFVAEDYHKNYYEQNQDAGYCRFVIAPKIQKLFKNYKNDLKGEYA
jgi:peptide-methionine (S)-S-oxide reductase